MVSFRKTSTGLLITHAPSRVMKESPRSGLYARDRLGGKGLGCSAYGLYQKGQPAQKIDHEFVSLFVDSDPDVLRNLNHVLSKCCVSGVEYFNLK